MLDRLTPTLRTTLPPRCADWTWRRAWAWAAASSLRAAATRASACLRMAAALAGAALRAAAMLVRTCWRIAWARALDLGFCMAVLSLELRLSG